MQLLRYTAWALLVLFLLAQAPSAHAQSDDEIAERIVQDYRSWYLRYIGNCPCRYDTMQNGAPCEDHSAHTKAAARSHSVALGM